MQKPLAIKIITIFFLALILLLPLAMIEGKVTERRHYREQVKADVAASWTGSQQLLTPVLVLPYEYQLTLPGNRDQEPRDVTEKRQLLVPMAYTSLAADVETSLRYKGIYPVPVYQATVAISGHFNGDSLNAAMAAVRDQHGFQRWLPAHLALPVSDARGIAGKPTLSWQGENLAFSPGTATRELGAGLHALIGGLAGNFDHNASLNHNVHESADKTGQQLDVNIALQLRGMESLDIVPTGKQLDVKVLSDWPHPLFEGNFLPQEHTITDGGFSARWSINEFSSGVVEKLARCQNGNCDALFQQRLATRFFQPVDIYLQTERAIKYGILFIALSFVSFFLFEVLRKAPIHPIQYGFVGLALAIFYLLLISLSEHIHFLLAYSIAASACVLLLFFYLGHALGGYRQSGYFALALGLLYGVLFVIIQMEDFALLTGAGLLFTLLACLMLTTRKMDWYRVTQLETREA